MREVKPLANDAKDLLKKAISLLREIETHFDDKASAAEERGRQDVEERWQERSERIADILMATEDAIEMIQEVFDDS